jgi:cellulose synthase/poly-beta-1,6-N-acetylglucosamine synthase-like glycosyltransferase
MSRFPPVPVEILFTERELESLLESVMTEDESLWRYNNFPFTPFPIPVKSALAPPLKRTVDDLPRSTSFCGPVVVKSIPDSIANSLLMTVLPLSVFVLVDEPTMFAVFASVPILVLPVEDTVPLILTLLNVPLFIVRFVTVPPVIVGLVIVTFCN